MEIFVILFVVIIALALDCSIYFVMFHLLIKYDTLFWVYIVLTFCFYCYMLYTHNVVGL